MFNKNFKDIVGSIFGSENQLYRGATYSRRASARFEHLEDRRLLAINWINQSTSNFDLYYGANATLATEIVSRAVADWNVVITNFNYAEDLDANPNNNLNNTFNLSIVAQPLSAGTRGQVNFADQSYNIDKSPTAGTVRLDDNGGGAGWFFDATPTDDAEFTGLAGRFSSSFIDVNGQSARDDLYRTVLHEIGHALGITSDANSAIATMLTPLVNSTQQPIIDPTGFSGTQLKYFQSTRPSPQFGQVATFLGGHLYEGDLYLTNNDPTTVYRQGSGTPLAFVTHPNELLNDGRTVPAGNPNSNPAETARQFISDTDAKILADAYGYTVVLPSAINTAFASLDVETGTLLVQGDRTLLGFGTNDTITIDMFGSDIRVQVNGSTELFPALSVQQIVIAQNGGADTVTVAPGLASMRRDVQYVVSTNQDSAAAGTLGDDIVDINLFIPGFQTSLRAAIVDANGTAAGQSRSIYVPRGNYALTIAGAGGDTQGDLDVNRNITVIGSGAGSVVVNATSINDRIFDVAVGGALTASRMTLTGGNRSAESGGAIRATQANVVVDQAALVGNSSGVSGGAIYSASSAVQILNSVVTGNTAPTGSVIRSQGAPGLPAGAVISNSVLAKNTNTVDPNSLHVYHDSSSGGAVSGGNNLSDQPGLWNASPVFVNGTSGDVVQSFGSASDLFVVTSMVDSFNHVDDARALSIREAIDLANASDGTLQTVWMAPWKYTLTRDRARFGGGSLTDLNIAFGDLDIRDSMAIHGAGAAGATSVKWRPGVVDAVFDMIGDFNGNGTSTQDDGWVDGTDFTIWQTTLGSTTDLRADADDDGDVDGSDLSLWNAEFGNNLTVTNITT
jgi:predicted outer membrane repeat protein